MCRCDRSGCEAAFDEGMRSSAGFALLVNTPESKALRHGFFGERAASKIADVGAT
jgi:3-hydroxyacyl-CoA dehydrogenase